MTLRAKIDDSTQFMLPSDTV